MPTAPQVVARPTGDRGAGAWRRVDAARRASARPLSRRAQAAAELLDGRGGTHRRRHRPAGRLGCRRTRVGARESSRLEIVDVGPPPPNLAVIAARVAAIAWSRPSATGPASRDARRRRARRPAPDGAMSRRDRWTRRACRCRGRTADATLPRREGAGRRGGRRSDRRRRRTTSRYLVLDDARGRRVLVVTATGDLVARGVLSASRRSWPQGDDGGAYVLTPSRQGLQPGRLPAARRLRGGRSGLDARARAATAASCSRRTLERRRRAPDCRQRRTSTARCCRKSSAVPRITVATPDGQSTGASRARWRRRRETSGVPAIRAGRSSLGLVKFRRVADVRAEGCQTLARFTSGEPALVDCELGQGRAIVLASGSR